MAVQRGPQRAQALADDLERAAPGGAAHAEHAREVREAEVEQNQLVTRRSFTFRHTCDGKYMLQDCGTTCNGWCFTCWDGRGSSGGGDGLLKVEREEAVFLLVASRACEKEWQLQIASSVSSSCAREVGSMMGECGPRSEIRVPEIRNMWLRTSECTPRSEIRGSKPSAQ